MQSVFYRNLGDAQEKYNEIYSCARAHRESFTVEDPERDVQIFSHVLAEHPELFYTNTSVSIYGNSHYMEARINYTYTRDEALRIARQLDRVADEIIDELINDHQSDYDKVRVLHDYLKSTVKYDSDVLGRTDLTNPEVGDAYCAVGALLKHKCVCEGFAEAFKLLCDKVGVECWVVMGTGDSTVGRGPHAWNMVRINGYYHHVDVTWDNQYSDSASIPNYGYLNLSDEEISADHSWNRAHYPACPDSPYNYFKINDALIETRAELEGYLYENFMNEEPNVTFRVRRGSPLSREIERCIEEVASRAASRCKGLRAFGYSLSWMPEQMIYCLRPTYEF